MRGRVMMTLVVMASLVIGASGPPSPAAAQDEPRELWEAYPLEEREADPVPTPPGVTRRPMREPATLESDDAATGWSLGVLLVGALLAFAAGVLVPLLRHDRPQPLPSAGGPPERRVRTRRFAPGARRDRETSGARTSSDSRRE